MRPLFWAAYLSVALMPAAKVDKTQNARENISVNEKLIHGLKVSKTKTVRDVSCDFVDRVADAVAGILFH